MGTANITEVVFMRNVDMPEEDIATITVYDVFSNSCGAQTKTTAFLSNLQYLFLEESKNDAMYFDITYHGKRIFYGIKDIVSLKECSKDPCG